MVWDRLLDEIDETRLDCPARDALEWRLSCSDAGLSGSDHGVVVVAQSDQIVGHGVNEDERKLANLANR